MQLLQKVFRLRTCADSVFENRSRPCLLHQIRRCTAPCVDLVSATDYTDDVRSAELFLQGKDDEAVERLIARMNAAAEHRELRARGNLPRPDWRAAQGAGKAIVSSSRRRDASM